MVTAPPMFSVLRVRSHRAGPLRLLCLAVLLLGLVYTHGVSRESAAGHLSPVSATLSAEAFADDGEPGASVQPPAEGAARGEHGGGHEGPHPAQDCVSSQPEHGAELPAPCLAPLDAAHVTQPLTASGTAGPARSVVASPPLMGSSTILRI